MRTIRSSLADHGNSEATLSMNRFACLLLCSAAFSTAKASEAVPAAPVASSALVPSPSTCKVVIFGTPEEYEAQRLKRDKLLKEGKALIARLKAELESLPASARKREIERSVTEIEGLMAREERIGTSMELCPSNDSEAVSYVEEIVRRIEDCGTRNFPKKNGKSIYGAATGTFVIDRSGALVATTIDKPSGHSAIEDHVRKIIDASAPFGAVPVELHGEKFDRLEFDSRFKFTHSNRPEGPLPKRACSFRQ
jgi:periplasmic protein TonB